tara:strand:+ start:379 stop:549 length:171 start_codon:yes stop_codon:yes gene_type:complete
MSNLKHENYMLVHQTLDLVFEHFLKNQKLFMTTQEEIDFTKVEKYLHNLITTKRRK